MADTITISSPAAYQTYQRDGSGRADIPIVGTYTGTDPASVEARWAGGAWTVIDANPVTGTFAGTLADQSQGQGALEVRDSGNTEVTDSAAYVGIGDVFVVGGQSNAVTSYMTNNHAYSHATLKAAVFDQADAWRECTDPTDGNDVNRGGSVWPYLATHILADQGVPVAFITTAKSGTGLGSASEHTWNKDWAPHPEYDDCIETVANSGVNAIRAMLWYQGESDTVYDTPRASYTALLGALVDNLKADFGFSDWVLIAAQTGHQSTVYSETRAQIDRIRMAIADAWDDDAEVEYGPLTYDVNLLDAGGDGVHFKTDAEAQMLADRWWWYIGRAVYGKGWGRAPHLLDARVVGTDQIEVRLTVDNAPLTLGASPTVGWRVVDGAGERTVESASLAGTAITLTLDQALSGSTTVSFGSGNDGVDCTIRDSATYPLPIEPFVDQRVAGINEPGWRNWFR